jgi:choline dehydrogenase-like flavoprotein
MIEDARALADGQLVKCDIVIVGAGAAGLSLALAISRLRRDLDLIVVEAGGRSYDFRDQTRYFKAESIGPDAHPPLELYRRRMLGGTTSIWGGRCIPLSPDDFTPRPEINRTGWPIPHSEISKYYPAALDMLDGGLCEFDAQAAFPGTAGSLAPGARPTGLVLDQLERFSPPADLAQHYRAELETSANVRILLNAACTDIKTQDGAERASGVVLKCAGIEISIQAQSTVIAAGGLETTRLLLWSQRHAASAKGSDRHLGNNYMTHLVADLGKLQFFGPRDALQLDYAKSRDGVWCRRLIQLDQAARRKHGLVNFVLRPSIPAIDDPAHGNAVLSASYFAKRFLIAEYARRLTSSDATQAEGPARLLAKHGLNMLTGAPDLARFSAFWLRNRILARRKIPSLFLPSDDGCYPLEVNLEQLPESQSRLRLGSSLDPNGLPRLIVDWHPGAQSADQLIKLHNVVGDAMQKARIGRLTLNSSEPEEVLRQCQPQGGHHIGTTRMSSDPKSGVVNADLEMWNTKSLYVLGSSVFPTSGFANPTLTIVALALRLAERLARRSTSGQVTANRATTEPIGTR